MITKRMLQKQIDECKNEEDVDELLKKCVISIQSEDVLNNDRFWNERSKMLLKSVILYLVEIGIKGKSFNLVSDVLQLYLADSEDDNPLKKLFDDYKMDFPKSRAVKIFNDYWDSAGYSRYADIICMVSVLNNYFNEKEAVL